MKKIILCFTVFFSCNLFAEVQFLSLPNSHSYSAVFPCTAEKKSVNSSIGITNALQCRVENATSVCVFLTSESPLDIQSFNKSGWKFIAEVNNQYALQLDKNYKNVYGRVVEFGGMGKAYAYELIRMQDGMQVNVKGLWMVSNGRMLRGTVSCAPNKTNFMKNESELFLKSFAVIK